MRGAFSAPDRNVIKRHDEALSELGVGQPGDGVELLCGHQQCPREALGLLLVVHRAYGPPGVDRVAVEAQRGDEAPLGMVRFERLDVGRQ
jgi:hypothetical protein